MHLRQAGFYARSMWPGCIGQLSCAAQMPNATWVWGGLRSDVGADNIGTSRCRCRCMCVWPRRIAERTRKRQVDPRMMLPPMSVAALLRLLWRGREHRTLRRRWRGRHGRASSRQAFVTGFLHLLYGLTVRRCPGMLHSCAGRGMARSGVLRIRPSGVCHEDYPRTVST